MFCFLILVALTQMYVSEKLRFVCFIMCVVHYFKTKNKESDDLEDPELVPSLLEYCGYRGGLVSFRYDSENR